jgi:hypothetical protein
MLNSYFSKIKSKVEENKFSQFLQVQAIQAMCQVTKRKFHKNAGQSGFLSEKA